MEPRAYFDVPSERDWTIAEREEFFAGQDAITGALNGTRTMIQIELKENHNPCWCNSDNNPVIRNQNCPFHNYEELGKTMGRSGYGAFKFSDLLVGDQFYISWRGTSLFTKVGERQAQYKDAEPQYFDEHMACRLVPND